MNEKCECTGLECIKCNPGPCEHRALSIEHDEDEYADHMKRMYDFTRNPDEKWASAVEKMLRSKSEKQISRPNKEESDEISKAEKKYEDVLNRLNDLSKEILEEAQKALSVMNSMFGPLSIEPVSKEQITRPSKDEYYLNIALAVSKRSTCLKRHYGCVIVKDDIIVATGYNGSPRGEENCCDRGSCKRADAERYTGYENCDSVHAEQNAIIAASHQQLRDATLYLACESYGLDVEESGRRSEDVRGYIEDMNPVPCPICRRMIRNSGISRVVNRLGDVLCL